jgi:hypothetical protein
MKSEIFVGPITETGVTAPADPGLSTGRLLHDQGGHVTKPTVWTDTKFFVLGHWPTSDGVARSVVASVAHHRSPQASRAEADIGLQHGGPVEAAMAWRIDLSEHPGSARRVGSRGSDRALAPPLRRSLLLGPFDRPLVAAVAAPQGHAIAGWTRAADNESRDIHRTAARAVLKHRMFAHVATSDLEGVAVCREASLGSG